MTERKRKLFITLGAILAITPFLGIPPSWKTFIYVVLGLWIACAAFFINKNFSFKKSQQENIKKEDEINNQPVRYASEGETGEETEKSRNQENKEETENE